MHISLGIFLADKCCATIRFEQLSEFGKLLEHLIQDIKDCVVPKIMNEKMAIEIDCNLQH